jgi:type I restriction enzyme M protein
MMLKINKISTFKDIVDLAKLECERLKTESKKELENASAKEKRIINNSLENKINYLNEYIEICNDAIWLTEKFGEGEYKDILGLCKLASRDEIKEKGYSLTPGAYVGVAPVEDDGVDFTTRMAEIHNELLALQAESNELMSTISKNMREMGL